MWRCWLLGILFAVAGAMASPGAAVRADTGAWATVAPMPTARERLAATTGPDGRIYALGGETSDRTGSHVLSTVEAYAPETNTWAELAPMPTARDELAAVTGPDGRIYAIGGFAFPEQSLDTVEAYAPSTNTWSSVAPMPNLRGPVAATVGPDGRIYVTSGATMDAYTPATGTWVTVSALTPALTGTVAAAGADGRIYVFGRDAAIPIASPELGVAYSPTANAWSPVAAPPPGYGILAAVASPDGRIYAIAGSANREFNRYTSLLEIYTIATNRWGLGPALPVGRADVAAALGRDDLVYAIGGMGSNGALSGVDVYAPPGMAGTSCRFVLGFAALHALIPAVVGGCLDDEQHNPANGDGLQHTARGLLVWRKADNFTAFTDGYHTWVNGPYGLQERLNSQRFPWETNPDHLPIARAADPPRW